MLAVHNFLRLGVWYFFPFCLLWLLRVCFICLLSPAVRCRGKSTGTFPISLFLRLSLSFSFSLTCNWQSLLVAFSLSLNVVGCHGTPSRTGRATASPSCEDSYYPAVVVHVSRRQRACHNKSLLPSYPHHFSPTLNTLPPL